MNCDVCPFLDNFAHTYLYTKYWKVDLGNDQEYLGRSYVSLRRHCGSLSELSKEEWNDLSLLIKKLEKLFKKTFHAKLLNWSCLMNNSFRQNPPNPHVHWHLIPRYEKEITFAEVTFKDPEFGSHYARRKEGEQILTEEKLKLIIKKLKNNLTSN